MQTRTITKDEAKTYFKAFLEKNGYGDRDADELFSYGMSFNFSSGVWADDADVSLRYWGYDGKFTVQINWSSSHRDIDEAVTALANYQAAIEWASKLSAFMKRMPAVQKETL